MNAKPDKLIPALYGGVIMGLISSIPFLNLVNCLCCAGVLLGGFLAVMFYKNNFTPDTHPFTSGDCMAVGALAGLFGAVVGTFLSLMFVALFGDIARQLILNMLRNSNLQIPPELLEKLEESMSEGFTGIHVMLRFIWALMADVLFGLLGGLIGYSFFRPKQRPMAPPPMGPPA